MSSDGETADFSLTVTNNGPSTAKNVVLQDKMAGVDVSSSQYSINNGAWQDWNKNYINLGTITAGTSLLIQFKADVTGTTLINKAEVSSTTRDLIRINNYQSYTTQSSYTITATTNGGGTIQPNGNVNVYKGNSQSFTITPNAGMKLDDVQVDGISQGAINSYTFNDVTTNHTINANFSHITHTITATAGTGGNINPSGSVTVNELDDQTFTITPDTGYIIDDVLVDGISQGAITSYTFNNVIANHTINATFKTTGPNAYITNLLDNTVSVIDTTTNTVITTFGVGNGPIGVAVSSIGSRAYITNVYSNNVSVINTSTNTVIATIPVGSVPEGIAVSPDGSKLYVTNSTSNTVSVINTATNTVTNTTPVGSYPNYVAVSPDGSKAYIANAFSNNVSVIDTATNTITNTINVGSYPIGIAFTPDGSKAYVANAYSDTVSVIDTATNTVTNNINVGDTPIGIVITPNGSTAYVANAYSNTVSVINTATNTVTNNINVGSYPLGVAITPDGSNVYVTNQSSHNVSVINTTTNTVTTTITAGIGQWPTSLGNFIG